MLSGKASYGSRATCISAFISVLSPDIYMQFLVLKKTILREKKEIKKTPSHDVDCNIRHV